MSVSGAIDVWSDSSIAYKNKGAFHANNQSNPDITFRKMKKTRIILSITNIP